MKYLDYANAYMINLLINQGVTLHEEMVKGEQIAGVKVTATHNKKQLGYFYRSSKAVYKLGKEETFLALNSWLAEMVSKVNDKDK